MHVCVVALHVVPVVQPRHVRVPVLQPSSIVPQAPPGQLVSGVHVLTHLFVAVLHTSPAPHAPHATDPPQPSGAVPQLKPLGHDVAAVHLHVFVAASQVPNEQLPQWIEPPQPSG